MLRAIHIFPHFENELRIQDLRKKYDRLYGLINPHITLVFPFESDISTPDLERHITQCVSGERPFRIVLQGVTGASDGYLFLNVKRGTDEIVALHDTLYSGPMCDFLDRTVTYVPHVTVGHIDDPQQFRKAISETQELRDEFETIVSSIYVESISETGLSHIEVKIDLSPAWHWGGRVENAHSMRVLADKSLRDTLIGLNVAANGTRRIDAKDVRALYDQANWWPDRRLEDIVKMLDTSVSVGAWNNGTLIGFVRAVSDGVFRAYIEDVVVDREYRGQGVGEALVSLLTEALEPLEVVSLFCEQSLTPFYELNDFHKTSQVVMHRKA